MNQYEHYLAPLQEQCSENYLQVVTSVRELLQSSFFFDIGKNAFRNINIPMLQEALHCFIELHKQYYKYAILRVFCLENGEITDEIVEYHKEVERERKRLEWMLFYLGKEDWLSEAPKFIQETLRYMDEIIADHNLSRPK